MFYAVVAALSMVACCYLLLRRGNAFAPDIMSPVRLRRWTAAFFAAMTLSHLWYIPSIFLTSSEDVKLNYLLGALLDYLILVPLAIVIVFTMLQDHRRPLWPVAVMTAPPVVIMAWCVASRSDALPPMLYGSLLLLGVCLIIYMVRATRQYGRWLRDNYADLEHKEVWQSFVVLVIILLLFVIYEFTNEGLAYVYVMVAVYVVLICYLLWRVETLSALAVQKVSESDNLKTSRPHDLHALLQKHCIDTQLYLQYDLTILQLAKAIGTNRFYLSQYFSSLDMNYNAYINDLRINHFISLYHKAVGAQCSFTAQQLALESGYRSYNTFRDAFKRKTGLTVTAWMKAAERE